MSAQKPCMLSISGSDSLAGAGIQADVKVAAATGSYCATAITVITAQNTLGVKEHFELPTHLVEAQINAVFTDLKIKALKVGMCYSSKIMLAVSKKLKELNAQNIVIDPVMYGSLGRQLIDDNAVSTLQSALFPLADLITPNVPEMCRLLNTKIGSLADLEKGAKSLGEKYESDVLLKNINPAEHAGNDLFYNHKTKNTVMLKNEAIKTNNTHGTGSSLSAAIASFLSADYSMEEAISQARAYINLAIASAANWNIGEGTGPIDHLFCCEPFLKK